MPDLIDAKTKKELLPVLKHLKAPAPRPPLPLMPGLWTSSF